jgi:hypothetical protein
MKKLYTKDDIVSTSIATAVYPFILVALYIIFGAYVGWALWCLWAWFVTPLGAPDLSFWNAVGLVILVSIFRYKGNPKKDDRETDVIRAVGMIFTPVAAVVAGWVVQAWFM